MKYIKIIMLFIANLLIDLAVLSKYQIFGIVPSVSIPLIVVLSIYYSSNKVLYFAIFQGIFQDIAFSKILGSSALIFYLISYYTIETDIKKVYNLWHGLAFTIVGVIFSKVSFTILNIIFYHNKFSYDLILILSTLLAQLAIGVVFYLVLYFVFYYFRKRKLRHYI